MTDVSKLGCFEVAFCFYYVSAFVLFIARFGHEEEVIVELELKLHF